MTIWALMVIISLKYVTRIILFTNQSILTKATYRLSFSPTQLKLNPGPLFKFANDDVSVLGVKVFFKKNKGKKNRCEIFHFHSWKPNQFLR